MERTGYRARPVRTERPDATERTVRAGHRERSSAARPDRLVQRVRSLVPRDLLDHPDLQGLRVRAGLPDRRVRPARLVRQAPRWLALPASLRNL